MITAEEIARLIESPGKIDSSQLDQLLRLSDEYPFSPLFSQLYLTGLAKLDPITFEKKLKEFAYKVPDRAQLFALVNSAAESTDSTDSQYDENMTTENSQANLTSDKVEDQLKSRQDVLSGEEVTESPKESKFEESTEEESEHEVIRTSDDPDHSSHVDQRRSQERQPLEAMDSSDDSSEEKKGLNPLEKDILAHAVSSSIFLEVDQEIVAPFDSVADKSTSKSIEDPEELDNNSIDDVPIQEEYEEESEKGTADKKHSFTGWMSQFIADDDLEKADVENKKQRIEVKKEVKPFFSPVRKAKESLDESRLPVSETLAKVYAAQGNYPKAIEAYQKLLLNFPEKKSFFALQIESLKRKLK